MSTLVSLSAYYKALSGAQLKVVSLSGTAFLLFLNLGQTWLTSTAAHSDLSKLGTAALKYIYRVEVIRSWSVKSSVPHNAKETSQKALPLLIEYVGSLRHCIQEVKVGFWWGRQQWKCLFWNDLPPRHWGLILSFPRSKRGGREGFASPCAVHLLAMGSIL